MARYEINGSSYEIPDDIQGKELEDTLVYLSEQPTNTPQQQPQVDPEEQQYQYPQPKADIDPDTLSADKDWLQASRVIYKMNEGKSWEGDDKDLAEYGLDVMGWFNYNLPSMTINANRMTEAKQQQKDAFLYLMDTYDNVNASWSGAGRFFKGVLSDPTTYVGLGTFGVGLAGKEVGKQATKYGVRELLKQGLKTGVVTGIEGGMYATLDNTMRQSVEVSAGRRDSISASDALIHGAVGAGIGFAGGTLVDAASTKIASVFRKEGDVVAEQATPNVEPSVKPQDTPPEVTPEVPLSPKQPEAIQEEYAGMSQDYQMFLARTDPTAASVNPEEKLGEYFSYTKLDDLQMPHAETDIPYQRQNMAANIYKALNLAQELKGLGYVQLQDVTDQLRTAKMTPKEFGEFSLSVKMASDMAYKEWATVYQKLTTTKDPAQLEKLVKREAELMDMSTQLGVMNDAMGSHAGYFLRQRQEGLQGLHGLSDEVDKEAKADRIFRAMQDQRIKETQKLYDSRIDKAISDGDLGEAARLTVLKGMEVKGDLANLVNKEDASFMHKVQELAISNVFSPTTLMVNIIPSGVKTLYKPLLNAAMDNPFNAAVRKSMVASYSAMGASIKTAYKAALASFRYEQSILTRETGRLFEGELAIKGRKGGVLRIIPRLLNASDEFLSQINYHGFIAGRTAADAFEEGTASGLKGKALDSFVKSKVKEAIDNAYSNGMDEGALNVIVNKGINVGYRGEALAAYVKSEVKKNPQALRHGTDKEALDYTKDMLFKRQLSGKGKISRMASLYEEALHSIPTWRFMFQMFFRTPLRVFEEGVRMTPGLQILAPHFLSDLAGKNGARAQVRAKGEALMSLAFTGTVFGLYAQGKITGDGAYDNYKQKKLRGDTSKPEPYSIIFDDGSTWSFKNLDPIATPMKIIVNALERYDNLLTRQQQGEMVDRSEIDKALGAVTVGTSAVAQAFRDANLLAGIDTAIKLAQDLSDPEANDAALVKFLGEKLRVLVPNTMHKIAIANDPTVDDPKTFWQMVESRLLGGATLGFYDKNSPKAYNVLGEVRRRGDTDSLWSMFAQSTPKERTKGLDEDSLFVLNSLDSLSKETGAIFDTPYKHKLMGDLDLREVMTSDGKKTLYDRWNELYRQMQPEKVLRPLLEAGLPAGTHRFKGAAVETVNSTINQLRESAFYQLMAEESQVSEEVVKRMAQQAEAQSGMFNN